MFIEIFLLKEEYIGEKVWVFFSFDYLIFFKRFNKICFLCNKDKFYLLVNVSLYLKNIMYMLLNEIDIYLIFVLICLVI